MRLPHSGHDSESTVNGMIEPEERYAIYLDRIGEQRHDGEGSRGLRDVKAVGVSNFFPSALLFHGSERRKNFLEFFCSGEEMYDLHL